MNRAGEGFRAAATAVRARHRPAYATYAALARLVVAYGLFPDAGKIMRGYAGAQVTGSSEDPACVHLPGPIVGDGARSRRGRRLLWTLGQS